ncbi:GAF domain-containing protein [Alteromonadaceae bacterium 2753L.S.0a.02]|nr:GAF domain-containing protein [Alteromonadaceae bacterium 2753L.S.0a.02]
MRDNIPYGTLKIDQLGSISWLDNYARVLLNLDETESSTQLGELVQLAGELALDEYLKNVLEAASYKNAESAILIHPKSAPSETLMLSVWQNSELPEELICHIAPAYDADVEEINDPQNLLTIIGELQKDYIADKGAFYVFGRALKALLNISNSEYGFIGDILLDSNGERFLKTRAITNIAWNAETREFYKKHAPSGMAFYNQNTLFGATVKSGKQLISNAPQNHPASAGIPDGHPGLHAYMGLPIFSGDEFVGIAGLANRPGGYDENQAQQLRPLLNTLGMLITAYHNEQKRKKAEAELATKVYELDRANKAKSRFFASMSHELRTPLNSVLGFSRRLYKSLDSAFTDRDRNAMESIIRNAQHLSAMIDDVLDLSKMEAGHMTFKRSQIPLHSVLKDAVANIQGMTQNHGVVITDITHNDLREMMVWVDERRTLQVVLNLLSNAIKYGGGNAVEVSLEITRPGEIALVVSDQGPGIKQTAKQMLFQDYSRLLASSHSGIEGTGLGLALVAEITQQMGGRNWVNTAPGEGSRFYAAFPILDKHTWAI